MSTAIFKSIRKLACRDKEMKLIIYLMDSSPDEEFISLLSSLAEIDFIVLKCESLRNLCEIIHPHQVFGMENGDNLELLDHAKALLSRVKDSAKVTSRA